MEYYVWKNNNQTGPYEWGELVARWFAGKLTNGDLVWGEGMTDWVPVETILNPNEEEPEAKPEQRSALVESILPTKKLEEKGEMPEEITEEDEELIEKCIEIMRQERKASTSLFQGRLRIGYTRAARVVDILEQRGYLEAGEGAKPRKILKNLDEESPIDLSLFSFRGPPTGTVANTPTIGKSPPSHAFPKLITDNPEVSSAVGVASVMILIFLLSTSYALSWTILSILALAVAGICCCGRCLGMIIGVALSCGLLALGSEFIDSKFPNQAQQRDAEAARNREADQLHEKLANERQEREDAASGATDRAIENIDKERQDEATKREEKRLKQELNKDQ